MIGRMMRRRPSGWFALAALLAFLAGLATIRATRVHVPTLPVLVAAFDLPAGTGLDGSDRHVRAVPVPAAGVLPGTFRAPADVRGRTVAVPLGAGEPVTQAALGGAPDATSRPLAAGERAVSIPLATAGAAAALLVPGVRVDVVASPDDASPDARVVVAGAEILARAASAAAGDSALPEEAVLVRVGERDALRLIAALDRAPGVRVLPRPVSEVASGAAP